MRCIQTSSIYQVVPTELSPNLERQRLLRGGPKLGKHSPLPIFSKIETKVRCWKSEEKSWKYSAAQELCLAAIWNKFFSIGLPPDPMAKLLVTVTSPCVRLDSEFHLLIWPCRQGCPEAWMMFGVVTQLKLSLQ
ncbi:hypothetical protein chiPu_0003818 [Chiloscyllium punctatum]|uniref:Uncharacterized protein n=1 Tax=Chiloscyllium punctatum TaxID=137246 RepID=A0A401S4V3_CHIPU|nr:hypothetical protein [Chiloscyllium punctatum]